MRSELLTFTGSHGATLSGRLDLPADGEPIGAALFAHCFTCSKNLNAVLDISRSLTLERVAVFRFDFTGLGESDGEFEGTTLSTNVDDLVAAADALAERGMSPDILIGHSLGGAAVVRAARKIPGARVVVTIGAPYDPAHVTRLFVKAESQIENDGEAEVDIGGRPFQVRMSLLDDLRSSTLEEDLRNLERPLLVCHAPLDQTVGIGNAADIFHAARHPKSFVSLDKADHLLSNPADARYVGRVLGAWASRYLEHPEPEETVAQLATRQQVATRTAASGYRTEIIAAGHGMVADEPIAVGGEDTGPSPYDFLLAGLGACTGMTLRMYADRKGWPLHEVDVHMSHGKVHAIDEANCDESDARLDRIDRSIELFGDLSGEQRARLLEIADRCPVHRTLTEGSRIVTNEKEQDTPPGPADPNESP